MSETDTDEATTFTQEQVTAAATKAAKEAERKARQTSQAEIAATLGVTVDEAKAIIAKARADEEANTSELDKARKAQADAEAAAAKATAEAAATLARANATTALAAAGVQPAVLDDAIRLIDTTAADLPAEIEALKGRLPALFTTESPAPATPPTGVQPPRPPANGTGGTTAADRAKARFEAMNPRKPAA